MLDLRPEGHPDRSRGIVPSCISILWRDETYINSIKFLAVNMRQNFSYRETTLQETI